MKMFEFVLVNEVKGIHVEMTQFTSYLAHPCTVENICTSQRGLLDDTPRTSN